MASDYEFDDQSNKSVPGVADVSRVTASTRVRMRGTNVWMLALIGVIVAVGGVGAISLSARPALEPGASISSAPQSSLPPSKVTAATAATAAKSHVDPSAVLMSTVAGTYGETKAAGPKGTNSGPVDDLAATRLVWAVTYSEEFVLCPPDGSPCWSPRPGTTIVYLDYATGDYLESSSYAPAP
jgi:hypothetical protein